MLGAGPLGDLLDVGGASGIYLDELKKQTRSYTIIDISPEMIALARRLDGGAVPLTCEVASVYEIPYPDDHFDTVLAMGVLEYLDEPWQALAEMKRVARPGGLLLVSFPNADSPMRRLSKFIYRFLKRDVGWRGLFHYAEVKSQAKKLDLELLELGGYNAQLFPSPFTWRLKWLAFISAVLLERVLWRLGQLLGTSFIVKLRKRG
ncbi:MAG TPA: class I SAM-dependent methyltransferase [Armatimonadota bacterium]|nr:class I SAM-dependent methyltransferase [Armatimonadota bacterium]